MSAPAHPRVHPDAYACGLRGEPVWHLVPADPVLSTLDGVAVVITLCAAIGRYRPAGTDSVGTDSAGPASPSTAPELWPCLECGAVLHLGG